MLWFGETSEEQGSLELGRLPCKKGFTNPPYNVSVVTEIMLKWPQASEGGARRACCPFGEHTTSCSYSHSFEPVPSSS